MTTSRDRILSRLRAAQPELGAIETVGDHLPVVPQANPSPQGLLDRFVEQAELLASEVHLAKSPAEAIQLILGLLGEEERVLSWAFEHIPLPGLEDAFVTHAIQLAAGRDETVRVGITGADAALAATGSLVLLTGAGKPRLASLLPPVHIAIIRQSQILADLETWLATLRREGLDAFRETTSAMIISGPSRTADIAMQLMLGMHGPAELHIVILMDPN
jgi:L-lactate dehydrogenase complex protein LldG